MKEVFVWKGFEKEPKYTLLMGINGDIGEYFKTMLNKYFEENKKPVVWKSYYYTGFPYGDKPIYYSNITTDLGKDFNEFNYHTIEELYEFAQKSGFKKEHIDAFINEEEVYWKYDEEEKLIEKAIGWSWNF